MKCASCKRVNLHRYDMFYVCSESSCPCTHLVCRMCALQQCSKPFLQAGGTKFPSIHRCPLHVQEFRLLGYWTCDIGDARHRGHMKKHGGKCLSQITSGEHSKYTYGLGCRNCDFDVCLKCVFTLSGVDEVQQEKL